MLVFGRLPLGPPLGLERLPVRRRAGRRLSRLGEGHFQALDDTLLRRLYIRVRLQQRDSVPELRRHRLRGFGILRGCLRGALSLRELLLRSLHCLIRRDDIILLIQTELLHLRDSVLEIPQRRVRLGEQRLGLRQFLLRLVALVPRRFRVRRVLIGGIERRFHRPHRFAERVVLVPVLLEPPSKLLDLRVARHGGAGSLVRRARSGHDPAGNGVPCRGLLILGALHGHVIVRTRGRRSRRRSRRRFPAPRAPHRLVARHVFGSARS